jgi:ribonuclease-3
MDNPNNKLIKKEEVEHILNYFENIGDNNERLLINNLDYYQQAFVHESYYQAVQNSCLNNSLTTNNVYIDYIPLESNERLEFLGDSMLKAIMGRYLFERFKEEREGFLTILKIKIEKCSMLHKFGLTLGFRNFILLSLQVENQTILDIDRGRGTQSYYEDSFEAFVGAILEDFGDKGYIYADRFIRSVIENTIDFAELISKNENFKDSIQRFFQSMKFQNPTYLSINEENPLYRKVFTKIVIINKTELSQMDVDINTNILNYTERILEYYKIHNPEIYMTLIDLYNQDKYILGIGYGRKVNQAEQNCAKEGLLNLNLDLNF